jgi:hypothetical protein
MSKNSEFRVVLKDLQELYPEAGLSFGYIGNVGRGYGTFEDLEWYFFTKVWNSSHDGFYRNCHNFRIGLTPKMRETSPLDLMPELVKWLDNKVVPDYGTPCTR